MIRKISLQLKLVILVSIVTTALTGAIVSFQAFSLRKSVDETFTSQLTGITIAINGRYEESHSFDDVQQIFDYIQSRNTNVLELTLHGSTQKIMASTNRSQIGQPVSEFSKPTLDENKTFFRPEKLNGVPIIRMMAPLREDGNTVGAIEMVVDMSTEAALITERIRTSILVGAFIGILFLFVLWFSLRKLLIVPLLKLRQGAIAVRLGTGGQRVTINASQEITEVADAFNDMVHNLDHRYYELQQALHSLQETQEQLVQSEKMVALGRLVAGIAHEINTPIGVAVTATSYLEQRSNEFTALFEGNRMKKSDLDGYLKSTKESTDMIQSNLRRASELIKSFKQVSVDQSSDAKRSFNLLHYVDDIVRSLHPTIKKTKQRVSVIGDLNGDITTDPGAVSQIMTNLIMNSLIHAYEPEDEGNILIKVNRRMGKIVVQYADDGKGMPKEVVDKIFDPFFTTNRSRGGTGLGMHIVYNLVTQKLGGTIQCISQVGKGTTFIMEIPITQEEEHGAQSA